MKLMNEAIDKVRREEQSHNILLKRTRYLWLKNPENLTIRQNETFGSLKDLRLKTLRAYKINWSFAISGIKIHIRQKAISNDGVSGQHTADSRL